MMSSNEQKRLEELNKAIGSRKIPYLSSSSDLLPYDLVLLLTHHPLIRQLVRDIAASNTQSAFADEHVQGPAQDVIPERAEVIVVAEKPGQALGQLQAELDSVRGQLAQLQRDKQALQASLQAEQQRRQDLARQLAGQASSPLSTAQTFLKAARADPQLSSLWLGAEPENEQDEDNPKPGEEDEPESEPEVVEPAKPVKKEDFLDNWYKSRYR
jgi:TolA-binding protein